MKKFKRVFVPNYNLRFSPEPLKEIAEKVVFVCERPMFNNLIGPEHSVLFEGKIDEMMIDYDPEQDLIAFYGDPIIFAIMIVGAIEEFEVINVARFSSKTEGYLVRKINSNAFCL